MDLIIERITLCNTMSRRKCSRPNHHSCTNFGHLDCTRVLFRDSVKNMRLSLPSSGLFGIYRQEAASRGIYEKILHSMMRITIYGNA